MDLKGKVALVTGGSGDVGGAIARVLATAGVDVVISYAGNLEGATTTVEVVQAAGRRSLSVQLDQRDPEAINAVVDKMVGEFGQVDILVNNAAWNIGIPFTELDALDAEIWDRVQETNTRGPYLLARAFAPHLRAHGAGRIVNIASAAGLFPGGSSIAYSVSKASLIHLTRCLAVALAPDVTVNCIAPGLVEGTRMAQRIPKEMIELWPESKPYLVELRALKTSLRKWSHSVARSRLLDKCLLSTGGCQELCTEPSWCLIFPSFVLDGIGGSAGNYANAERLYLRFMINDRLTKASSRRREDCGFT